MITSRKIEDLHPKVQELCKRFLVECEKSGITIIITCTYRDRESQKILYARGRTMPGARVTNAKPGDSMHEYRVAFDCVPTRNGKPIWDAKDPIWQSIGAIGRACGLEWAGDWKKFREFPHFQYTGGLTLKDFKKGLTIKE